MVKHLFANGHLSSKMETSTLIICFNRGKKVQNLTENAFFLPGQLLQVLMHSDP